MKPARFLWTLALVLGASVNAAAQDQVVEYYLEGPGLPARNDAVLLQQVATEQGWASRIVRRYGQGEGWQYVVLVEGFADQAAAEQAAGLLTTSTRLDVDVYRREGRTGTLIGAGVVAGGTPPGDIERGSVSKDLPSSDEILEKTVRAMGGREAGLEKLSAAENIHFRYKRTLERADGTIVASHDFLRTPTQQRLEVQVLSGPGVSSTTIVNADKAWLISGGQTLPRDAAKSKEVLSEFGPEHLLSYPLRFASLVASDPAHGKLVTTDSVRTNNHAGYLLEYVGPEVGGSISVLIDGADWRIVEVSSASDAGLVRVQFEDWRQVDAGVVVPFRVRMERDGALIEVLEVEELSAPAKVSAASFEPSVPATPAP